MADVDITHRLHGLLPITQQGVISIYRALKQRPKTGKVATRVDIPVTLDTAPGVILRDIYDLWSDLATRPGRDFQLIPILHRSLRLLRRPLSDPAYLLVLSRSLEMKQRAHCLLHICWDDRRWTTAAILPAYCNWYTLRELCRHVVSPSTGVKMDASVNGDLLDESMVQVLDGSVISVILKEGFSGSIRNDLQGFLNRQVNLFHLPPDTTGDTDVSLKAFVPQGRTSATGFHFECHTVFAHWRSTLMATAQKYHPGSLITESHLFPVHGCFEYSLPLFDPTVRHFLVPHDLKELAGMKCALLTIHTMEHTVTGGFYCPARVNRSHFIDICNQSKEWILYHNLNRVGVDDIQVEHGDFFDLCEKVPGKEGPPSPSFSRTFSMAHIRNSVGFNSLPFQGPDDQGTSSSSSPVVSTPYQSSMAPSPGTISNSQDQHSYTADLSRCPPHLQLGRGSNGSDSASVRNYAESTPYQLQAELDDASVVSEDPKYGCEAGCLYCGQPCVRSKLGHVFHQCPEHYRWWKMQKK